MAQSGAQMSRTVEDITRQLESEIKAAATSTAMTSEINARADVEGMCLNVQSQIHQNREDARRRDEENRQRMDNIAVGLERLT